MARDRQRAKQRRRRATGGSTGPRSRAQLARDIGLEDQGTPVPEPLEHASADVDQARLAEAGALPPDVRGEGEAAPGGASGEGETAGRDRERQRGEARELPDRAPDELEEPAALRGAERAEAPERERHRDANRVVVFLRNCIEELRRVQWPDRRQVGQGTAVVIGFVVIAGTYLGLLDAIWKPLIQAIL